jgi:hypothetical protein
LATEFPLLEYPLRLCCVVDALEGFVFAVLDALGVPAGSVFAVLVASGGFVFVVPGGSVFAVLDARGVPGGSALGVPDGLALDDQS